MPDPIKPVKISDKKEFEYRNRMYNDSLDLYNSYQELRKELNNQGYEYGHISSSQILDSNKIINYVEGKEKGATGINVFNPFRSVYKESTYKKVNPKKERENIYSVEDLVPGKINKTLGKQLFSNVIKPKSIDSFVMPFFTWSGNQNDGRVVFNYEDVKPVQPVTYMSPSVTPNKHNTSQKSKELVQMVNHDNPKLRKPSYQQIPTKTPTITPIQQSIDDELRTSFIEPAITYPKDAHRFTAGNYLESQGKPSGYVNYGEGEGRKELYENGGIVNNDQIQGKTIDAFYSPKKAKSMGSDRSYPYRTLENPSYDDININPPQYHDPYTIREMRIERRLTPSNVPNDSSFNQINNNDIGFLFNEKFGI